LDFIYKFWKGGVDVYNIKARLSALGKSQVWLLKELRDRGFNVQPPQLSNIINGIYTYPKANGVLEECNNVLKILEVNVTK
jgi:hypothetical protein